MFADDYSQCPCGDGDYCSQNKNEECDEGERNGQPGSCCTKECKLKPRGTLCRSANGECDVEEKCDGDRGSCPRDGFKSSRTVCRGSKSACDKPGASIAPKKRASGRRE